jgi:hypothetical protein
MIRVLVRKEKFDRDKNTRKTQGEEIGIIFFFLLIFY